MITPAGSVAGVAADETQNSNSTGAGRPRWMGNRRENHLAAKQEDWENQTIGDALYLRTLMIRRNR